MNNLRPLLAGVANINLQIARSISCTQQLQGRRFTKRLKWLKKIPHPYDSRFPMSTKDIAHGARMSGKRSELLKDLGHKGQLAPQAPGYYSRTGKFHVVPEMIPEFVVPDLSDCQLKPYVSYKVGEIKQSEMTPAELFKATYARDTLEKFHDGKIDVNTLTTEDILKKKP